MGALVLGCVAAAAALMATPAAPQPTERAWSIEPVRTDPVPLRRELVVVAPEAGARRTLDAPAWRGELAIALPPAVEAAVGPWLQTAATQRGVTLRLHRESERGAMRRVSQGHETVALVTGDMEPAAGLIGRVAGTHRLAVVVHGDSTVDGLTRALLRSALTGQATSWSHLGGIGRDTLSIVVTRAFTSDPIGRLLLGGDRLGPEVAVVVDEDAVARRVAANPACLGVGAAPRLLDRPGIRPLPIDLQPVRARGYPLQCPLRIVARPPADTASLRWLEDELGRYQ